MNTYKLLIVDDFFVERETAKEIIAKSGLPLEVVGEAENGREALDFIGSHSVDIVLADIEMPIMNGLELMKIVNEQSMQLDVIFFSLYNRFEYVHEAIGLGAFGYVLKPIKEEELLKAVGDLITKKDNLSIERERLKKLEDVLETSKPILINRFLYSLFTSDRLPAEYIRKQSAFFEFKIGYDKQIYIASIEVDDYSNRIRGFGTNDEELFLLKIEHNLNQFFVQAGAYFTRIANGKWAALLPDNQLGKHDNLSIWEYLQNLIDRMKNESVSLSIGVSEPRQGLNGISKLFKAADEALAYKFSLGFGQLINAGEVDISESGEIIPFNVLLNEIELMIQRKNLAETKAFIHTLFNPDEHLHARNMVKIETFNLINALMINLNNLHLSFKDIFGKDIIHENISFETINTVRKGLIDIFSSIYLFLEEKDQASALVVRRVKKFIDEHFSEKITVKTISENVFYSPNYLNNLFKKETGSTLLEYLTKYRVEKAKKLLVEPDMKIYLVSKAVGYSQESYFRSVFKKQTGCSPKEYIQRAIS